MASKARQLGSAISASGTLSAGSGVILAVGTTAGRPSPATDGMLRVNSTTNFIEVYYNQNWVNVASVLGTFIAEILVVGGGGAGGPGASNARGGGGGGAGGYISAPNFIATTGVTYTITVGAGGTTGSVAARTQTNGSASSILNGQTQVLTLADGGGFGGTAGGIGSTWSSNMSGNNSATGSGGGGANSGGSGGTGGVYGNIGGSANNTDSSSGAGGGGGGAGGVGQVGTSSVAGAGGIGITNTITDSSVVYAQGGGGATPSVAGSAGGAANTGGGGGGGQSTATGTNGSSGIVVIKYPDTLPAATVTGSPQVISITGYRIYRFTSSGTITF